MWSNTKSLLIVSFLVILSGFGFLWFGSKEQYTPPSEVGTKSYELGVTPSSTNLIPSSPSPSPTSSPATQGIEGERAQVIEVVDGDTIKLGDGKTVRFIGIDTPETVDPRRPIGCFGKEASNETKSLLVGKMVILQKDISDTDKYKRLLRYIFLPLDNGQTLFINDYLVREGFAKVYTYPPDVKFDMQFKQAETEAREAKKGLWERCN